jgi:two-component system sensor histidine kinase MprB
MPCFTRFSRAEESRTGPGTGLGLAVVAEIATAHGGTAAAANREIGGADVSFSIPHKPRATEAGGRLTHT